MTFTSPCLMGFEYGQTGVVLYVNDIGIRDRGLCWPCNVPTTDDSEPGRNV